jgi:hypothetical protein
MNKPMTQADIYKAIEEIDEVVSKKLLAIEQAEKQEPVAWMLPEYGDVLSAAEVNGKPGIYNIPLYTVPVRKKWIGLTIEEVNEIRKDIFEKYQKALLVTRDVTSENDYSAFNFYRAIEDKLRSKND